MNDSANQKAMARDRQRWRQRALVAATLLLLVALAWVVLAPQPVRVELATAAHGPLAVTVSSQGMVRVHDRYVIAAPVAARLERIMLRVGDRVRPGEPVALLAPLPVDVSTREQFAAGLRAAQSRALAASLASQQAQSQLQLALREQERVARLVGQQFLAQQAADHAETSAHNADAQAKAAQARHAAAMAEVHAARAAVEAASATHQQSLTLTAPVAGQVLAVQQQSERTLPAGTPLITLGDPRRFEIVVDVLSADAVNIRPGMTMLLDEWGGEASLAAIVRLVEPAAFTKISALGVEEQRVNIIADPVSPLHALGDGYRVLGRIIIWQRDHVLKVPGSSLFRNGKNWQVFAVENSTAVQRTVQIGQRNADEAQIVGGLAAGTVVVRFPGNQLSDGSRVSAIKP